MRSSRKERRPRVFALGIRHAAQDGQQFRPIVQQHRSGYARQNLCQRVVGQLAQVDGLARGRDDRATDGIDRGKLDAVGQIELPHDEGRSWLDHLQDVIVDAAEQPGELGVRRGLKAIAVAGMDLLHHDARLRLRGGGPQTDQKTRQSAVMHDGSRTARHWHAWRSRRPGAGGQRETDLARLTQYEDDNGACLD